MKQTRLLESDLSDPCSALYQFWVPSLDVCVQGSRSPPGTQCYANLCRSTAVRQQWPQHEVLLWRELPDVLASRKTAGGMDPHWPASASLGREAGSLRGALSPACSAGVRPGLGGLGGGAGPRPSRAQALPAAAPRTPPLWFRCGMQTPPGIPLARAFKFQVCFHYEKNALESC